MMTQVNHFMRSIDEATSKKMSVEPQEKIDVTNAELVKKKESKMAEVQRKLIERQKKGS